MELLAVPRRRRLICGVLTAAGCVFGQFLAQAHGWYEELCCKGEHCEPVADGAVQETADGFTVPSGELLPYADSRVHRSHDMHFHWCHMPSGLPSALRNGTALSYEITLCLYAPPRSF